MKIIKVTTNNEISLHEYPAGGYFEQMKVLRELIGEPCELVEHVTPRRLYDVIGASSEATIKEGDAASILIDEDGYEHNLEPNPVGCFLYGTELHGFPILGNMLIIGECYRNEGIDFCGLSEE